MSLPKVAVPTVHTTLPSNKDKFSFRPMIFKEEKILRMARQSGEVNERFQALLDVVNACSMNGVTFNDRPIYDLEFAFTQIRAASISNVIDLSYSDDEDGETRTFQVDLNKITISKPEKEVADTIELSPNVYLKMRHPAASVYTNKSMYDTDPEASAKFMIFACLGKIYNGDEITDLQTTKYDEVVAWLDELPIGIYRKIEEFMESIPTMEYTITWTNKKGTERKVVLRTLEDFFMF